MKKKMKKLIKALLLITAIFALAVPVSAKPSRKTVIKKYDQWTDKHIFKGQYRNPDAYMVDINKDGIPELLVQYENGVRSGLNIYTYKNGKIVRMKSLAGVNGFEQVRGKKYLAVEWSNGYNDSGYTVYKMSGTKLKQVCKYQLLGYNTYLRNGQRISQARFQKFMKTLQTPKFVKWVY